eukprot:1403089-Prymnesium_polylepis.1
MSRSRTKTPASRASSCAASLDCHRSSSGPSALAAAGSAGPARRRSTRRGTPPRETSLPIASSPPDWSA